LYTTEQYWQLAFCVNSPNPRNAPEGFTCDRVQTSKGYLGSGEGSRDGFQAAVYRGANGRVLAIAGTQRLAMSDYTADLRIGLHVMPNQASSAFKFYEDVVGDGGVAVIVGHSLGGALAQVLGYWCDLPFVTFNAPGMALVLAAARYNLLKPDVARRTRAALPASRSPFKNRGLNFVVEKDLIGRLGKHYGEVIVLKGDYPGLFSNHSNLIPALTGTQTQQNRFLLDVDPFQVPAGTFSVAEVAPTPTVAGAPPGP
jgi:hypothetical protein